MQRDLTLLGEITGSWQALEQTLRAQGDALQAGWQSGTPGSLDTVTTLHFLSLFVIPPAGRTPALVVLEASFDGERDAFLDELVRTSAALLQTAFSSCAGYPATGTPTQLRAYLGRLKHANELFYVGCPGLYTQRIAEDDALATEVKAAVRRLSRPPLGRRWQLVREVWQGISPRARDLALNTAERPYWVRNLLYERPLATLYGYVQPPLALFGWLILAMVALEALHQWKGWLVDAHWPAIAPPVEVLLATWHWIIFFLIAGAVLTVVWAAIWIGEFPHRLRRGTSWYVIGAKCSEFACTTAGALPGLAAVLGLLAFAHWHGALVRETALLLVAMALGAVVSFALVWYARLLRIGATEPDESVQELRWDAARIAALREREDHLAQTHLVSVTTIRSGPLRMVTLRCVLFLIHWLARILYNPRGLFNTQSIHFARWTIIPGRRLLFVSNYDASFGGYLGVFATLGAAGVSAIWGNTEEFPRTFLLFGDGARDEQRFKARARASQVESLLWYRRYPALSVAAIERNAAIRADLARFSRAGFRAPEADLDAFLQRCNA